MRSTSVRVTPTGLEPRPATTRPASGMKVERGELGLEGGVEEGLETDDEVLKVVEPGLRAGGDVSLNMERFVGGIALLPPEVWTMAETHRAVSDSNSRHWAMLSTPGSETVTVYCG